MTLLRIERCRQTRQWMQAAGLRGESYEVRLSEPHSSASSQNERPHLRIPRVWRAKPRISRAIDTPRKKPLQKCEKLPWVQSRNMRPRDKAKAPPAVNKFLYRVTLPPDHTSLRDHAWARPPGVLGCGNRGRGRPRHTIATLRASSLAPPATARCGLPSRARRGGRRCCRWRFPTSPG